MSRRALAALAAALVIAVTVLVAPTGAPAVAAPPPTEPSGSIVDNPFIPEDRNLSECISAVPQPGCGSEARGGWRQGLVFAVVVVALLFVGWRITRTVRRNRRAMDARDEEPAGRHGP